MKVKITKLHQDAVIPKYSTIGDAGMDLTAVSKAYDSNGNIVYNTGLAMEIPGGYVGMIYPRSSVSKKMLALSNSVGIIDSGYRGEIMFKFKSTVYFNEEVGDSDIYTDMEYEVGERIGQIIIMPYPQIEFEEVDSLSGSDRGTGGFGSSGK